MTLMRSAYALSIVVLSFVASCGSNTAKADPCRIIQVRQVACGGQDPFAKQLGICRTFLGSSSNVACRRISVTYAECLEASACDKIADCGTTEWTTACAGLVTQIAAAKTTALSVEANPYDNEMGASNTFE